MVVAAASGSVEGPGSGILWNSLVQFVEILCVR